MGGDLHELESAFRTAAKRCDREAMVDEHLGPRVDRASELAAGLIDVLFGRSAGARFARLRPQEGAAELLVDGRWRRVFERKRSALLELVWYVKLRAGLPVGALFTVQGGQWVAKLARWETYRVCVAAGDSPLVVMRHVPNQTIDQRHDDPATRAHVSEAMGYGLSTQERAEATRCFAEALRRAEGEPRLEAWALCNLGGAAENDIDSLEYYRRALAKCERCGPRLNLCREILIDMAESLMGLGRFEEAEQALRRCIELTRSAFGDDDLQLVSLYRAMRRCVQATGLDDEASAWAAKAKVLMARFEG